MRQHRSPLTVSAVLLVTGFAAVLPSQGTQPATSAAHAILRSEAQFTEADLAALERGETVARVRRDADRREMAAFGAVRVRASYAFLLDRIRDIVEFKRNPMVLQIGRFATPPRIDDLNALTLDRDELDALRRCRPGDCSLRLPAADMDRIRTGVDWKAPTAAQSATHFMREFLLRRVQNYQQGGAGALADYADKKPPVGVRAEFERLVAAPYLLRSSPKLLRYVQHYPSQSFPGTEDFVYWSRERFGFKPVISLTHVTICTAPEPGPIAAFVTSKQIYASHYFDAALSVTAVIDAPLPDGTPSFYMVYLNRSRTPVLDGFFAALARGAIRGRTRDGMVDTLRVTKERLERDFRR